MSCRRIGALNDRYEWVANALELILVDQNNWIENRDFASDRLHLSRRGKRRLGQLYIRVTGLNVRDRQRVEYDKF